ncbi:MAG: signal peptidase II [Syntrophales bacterium]|jgi:signal peptidase II
MKSKYTLFTGITALILLLDQISKLLVTSRMALHESIAVLPGFLSITYVRNPGAAFGFLADASPFFRYIFFVAVTVAAIVLILQYVRKTSADEPGLIFSLSLIFGGAVGNLADRVRYGEVVDFLDAYIGSHHWPAFNAADSAITIGAVILMMELIRRGKERHNIHAS